MARNTAEAQRMVDAFAAAKLPLFVAYYRRTLPRFVKVKEIIDSGVLGSLRSITYFYFDDQMTRHQGVVPWRLQAEIAGGGLLLDLGSHALDLLDHLVGTLSLWRSTANNLTANYDAEDLVILNFQTAQEAEGTAVWNFGIDLRIEQKTDIFKIEGEAGYVTFSCFLNDKIRLWRDIAESFDIPHPPHVAQPLIQTIVDELLGVTPPGSCPSTGASALRTQRVMDQALSTYYGGREDGFWNRPWPKG
jgi:predicted dehydrogenase